MDLYIKNVKILETIFLSVEFKKKIMLINDVQVHMHTYCKNFKNNNCTLIYFDKNYYIYIYVCIYVIKITQSVYK